MRLREGWIGLEAIDLPETLREHFGAPADAGVMISHVEPGSPAESAGFALGDVLYEIDGNPVRSAGALRARLQGGGVGNDCEFVAARDGLVIEFETRIEEKPVELPEDGS